MSKKKNNQDGFVYSTNPNFIPPEEENAPVSFSNKEQSLKIFLDRLGGGKVVSRITGFLIDGDELEGLARELKQKCGVGGNVKEGAILIQGDHREKLVKLLNEKGFPVKKAGG